MKRKAEELNGSDKIFDSIINLKPKNKKSKLNDINQWVSGTNIANYLLGEPLLDWLNLYYSKLQFNENVNKIILRSKSNHPNNSNHSNHPNHPNNSNQSNEQNVLMHNGLQFENSIYDYLLTKFKSNEIIKILTESNHLSEIHFKQYSDKTREAIDKKVPIILQGVLSNNDLKLRGVADIIVRSDYINKLVKKKVLPNNKIKINGKLYYLIIDIKWTSMTLCVDGQTIRNEGRFKAYKGQLLIYNILLGFLQNYIPETTYIMAKSWKIDSSHEPQEGSSCFDLMGIINYSDRDSDYVNQTIEAINWIRYVREFGSILSPISLDNEELCVNMSNSYDTPWTEIKKDICSKTNDITAVWYLTTKQRAIGFNKNIKKWSDVRCTTSNLNMNSGSKSNTIDLILNINRQSVNKILPKTLAEIKDNRFNWKKKYPTDFYIDFETIGDTFMKQTDFDLDNSKGISDFVFMIGIGYEENSEWKFKVFFCDDYTLNDEYKICESFIKFIRYIASKVDPDSNYPIRLFHWSHAEQTIMKKIFQRHPGLLKLWDEYFAWIDMCNIFVKTPVVVKGSLCFKLKDVGKALYSHGLIETCWEEGKLSNGLNAMISGIKYYELKKQNLLTQEMEDSFVDIIKYNEIDCKTVWDIVRMLRRL